MPSVKDASPEVRVMGHPVRKRLIELLGEKQSLSFSDIREETGLPVGTLYYHLDVLSDLISQDHSRRYTLTKEGMKFYAEMAKKEGLPLPEQKSTSLIPVWIVTRLSNSSPASATLFAVVLASGIYMLFKSGYSLILMNLYKEPGIISALSLPASIIVYFIFSLAASYFAGRRFFSPSTLFVSSLAYIPFLLVSFLLFFGLRNNIDLFLILCQLASIILGAAYLTSQFGFRLERSLLLQLVYFASSTVIYFIVTSKQV